jgi:hypothetical protein
VISGHSHTYERITVDGLPYFVNGAGGVDLMRFDGAVPGTVAQYNDDFGAMRIIAQEFSITFEYITRTGVLVDALTLASPQPVKAIVPQSLESAALRLPVGASAEIATALKRRSSSHDWELRPSAASSLDRPHSAQGLGPKEP